MKKMLLAGAVVALAMSASAATYSNNVVGYVNVTINPGFNLVANPLNNGDNMLSTVLPYLATEDEVNALFWNGAGYDLATYFEGEWDSDYVFAPGSGCFLQNMSDEAFVATFVGEITVGEQSTVIPAGFSIVSNLIPQDATLSELGLPLSGESGEDYVLFWEGASYGTPISFFEGEWDEDATLSVGEALYLYNAGEEAVWTKTFAF